MKLLRKTKTFVRLMKVEKARKNEKKTAYTAQSPVGCVKTEFSSQTSFSMFWTSFSHCLGQKYARKPKFEGFQAFFHPVKAVQSFAT